MDYYARVQRSIDFIEDNLTEDISLVQAAAKAYCSLYHYHRIFQAMAKESVKEYIRKRRLTEAAIDLMYTEDRVLDIALKYQYESPEAFSRAFKKLFEVSPAQCRRGYRLHRLFPKINVYNSKIIIDGGIKMEPKIVYKDEMKVVGLELRTNAENNKNLREIPEFWRECGESGKVDELMKLPNVIRPGESLGICTDFDGVNFSYVIGVEVSDFSNIPQGMSAKTIPAAKYAVFTSKGQIPQAIQDTWSYIYETWFPSSGYERTDTADFELYDERCNDSDEAEVDIYIPIK